MIDLYYWPTPNGHKITIFLEEVGESYTIYPINIGRGDQFEASFLEIAPNNRIPAIIDRAPADGCEPISLFESGAILQYLAEKTGQFLPTEVRERFETMQWLFWQMGGFGPMLGQNHHFSRYAPEKIPYAINRYVKETERLYGVLDKRLNDRDFITGEYSIADIAVYPWAAQYDRQQIDLATFPNVKRWFDSIQSRPAVKAAYAKAEEINAESTLTEESRAILFGQGARP